MIYDNIFESKLGAQIYETAERTILDFSMHDALQGGVLVGFSGGADSVLLLLLLNKFRKLHGNFNILAFHVNHLIRGDEAERDEIFAREFAESIGVSFAYERIWRFSKK